MTNQQELELLYHKTDGHLNGGVYQHKITSKKFLIKFPNTLEEAQNEILAAKLYKLLDVKIANLELIEFEGAPAIMSEWIEDYVNFGYDVVCRNASGLFENFVIDAWLANWDVVGLENDNIGFVDDQAIRIDLGGSLLYRGMGALKGQLFTTHVTEICSMLNPIINYNSALVFKDVTVKHFLEGAAKIAHLDLYQSEVLENNQSFLLQLLARREDIIIKASQLEYANPEALLKVELCGDDNNYLHAEQVLF